MRSFYVLNYDVNHNEFVPYDVMPYLMRAYNNRVEVSKEKNVDVKFFKVPETVEDFKTFVKDESLYQFWSRCEYEIILVDWPCQKTSKKIDVYEQIMMNIDIVTEILMENINNEDKK